MQGWNVLPSCSVHDDRGSGLEDRLQREKETDVFLLKLISYIALAAFLKEKCDELTNDSSGDTR